MTHVFFQPYVGEEYHTGYDGKKLLILGESHHCHKICDVSTECGKAEECLQLPECENFTIDVLERFLNCKNGMGRSERWMRTFTTFTNVFLGGKADKDELLEFWDCVMFYNYVQVAVESQRLSPSQHDFEISEAAFFEVLEEYKPDLIIVWGARLEGYLPQKNKTVSDFLILNTPCHVFHYYDVTGKKISAYAVYHPSSSAFGYRYSGHLQEAFRLA